MTSSFNKFTSCDCQWLLKIFQIKLKIDMACVQKTSFICPHQTILLQNGEIYLFARFQKAIRMENCVASTSSEIHTFIVITARESENDVVKCYGNWKVAVVQSHARIISRDLPGNADLVHSIRIELIVWSGFQFQNYGYKDVSRDDFNPGGPANDIPTLFFWEGIILEVNSPFNRVEGLICPERKELTTFFIRPLYHEFAEMTSIDKYFVKIQFVNKLIQILL